MQRSVAVILLLGLASLGACSPDDPLNPSFPLLAEDARAVLADMRQNPRPPQRPVVVVSGLFDLGIAARTLADRLREHLTPDAPIITVRITGTTTPDEARRRLVEAVQCAFPSDNPHATAEVDVVAISLGGIIARDAAIDRGPGFPDRRLRIARLFTIATPHRGCPNATAPTFDKRVAAVRPGSEYLRGLDAALADADYEIIPYVRLGDRVVGAAWAGVGDEPAYWVANMPLTFAHADASDDPRILADIARRLRGEPTFTTRPPAPLPPGEPTPAPSRPKGDLLAFP